MFFAFRTIQDLGVMGQRKLTMIHFEVKFRKFGNLLCELNYGERLWWCCCVYSPLVMLTWFVRPMLVGECFGFAKRMAKLFTVLMLAGLSS